MLTDFLDKYLVNNWREAPKWFSTWIFILIALSPELYQLAVQYEIVGPGNLPAIFQKLINWVGFLGAVSRLADQKSIWEKLKPSKSAE